MYDNENKVGEDITPNEPENEVYTQERQEDIFSPVTSRDVFSHSKDQEAADARRAMEAEIKEETYDVYQGNPFDNFPQRETYTPSEPKAEQPAFNPYAAPERPQSTFSDFYMKVISRNIIFYKLFCNFIDITRCDFLI